MNVVIIGYGFVGRSVHNHLLNVDADHYIQVQDQYKNFFANQSPCEVAFICVPTPTDQNSEQDISTVKECIKIAKEDYLASLVVIKSTILPRHAEELCNPPGIIYCPEFLDQANPYTDNNKHIVGTDDLDNFKIYKKLFGFDQRYFLTSAKTASMIKYVHNTHGALKVSFFNEIFDICQSEKVDYREMLRILLSVNDNVGDKYTRIAADGQRGFGGTCFPKDTSAFVWDYECQTLDAALEVNKKYNRVN